jgi:serine protease
MSTPHVSGVIALMLSYKPDATPAEIMDALITTAENPETSGRNNRYGHGIVNAMTAINHLADNSGGGSPAPPTPAPANPTPECNGGSLEFELTFNTDGYGSESSWELTNEGTGASVATGGPYGNNDSYVTRECLPPGQCYTLTIFDSYGDG